MLRGKSIELVERCPECGSINIIHDLDRGEIVCGSCGLVIQERKVSLQPEWRGFTPEERESRSRVGTPTIYLLHDKGLPTTITRIGRDAFGKKLPESKRYQMSRLRKWQIFSRAQSSEERNLATALSEIELCASHICAPAHVREKAAFIYRKVLEKGLVRGRSIKDMAAAALYAACKIVGIPRTLREVAGPNRRKQKDVARCYRLIINKLNIKVPIPDGKMFVSKIAQAVGISVETQGLALEILREAKKRGVTRGKSPIGTAAAALYIACLLNDEKRSQGDIAHAADITEVTVRNRYKELVQQLNLNLNDARKLKR